MKKQKILVGLLLSLLFILSACVLSSNVNENKTAETIEETEHYKIIRSDFMYYYYIFNKNHDVIQSDGPFSRQPHISIVNDYVKFTLQAGTGIGTQWGFYYDTESDLFSQIFQCIYDQYNGMVAYGDMNKVVVRDIFDEATYYQEITSFREPFSEMVEPIIDVIFVNDGASVEVSYLTGDNYQEIIEVIDLY